MHDNGRSTGESQNLSNDPRLYKRQDRTSWHHNLLSFSFNFRVSTTRNYPPFIMKIAIVVLLCVAAAVAIELPRIKRQSGAATYVLPDGVDLIIGSIKSTFSCVNRIYGYYADVDNNCNIFHVCVPILDNNNALINTAIYSFACGNQTVFDQEHLVCVSAADFTGCGSSANLYDSINSRFGITDRPSG